MEVKSESEVAQSCPTLSDPMDCSPPGSTAHGILQSGVMEWVASAFSMLKYLETLKSFFSQVDLSVHCQSVSSVAQSCLTLCNPMNHTMPGLPVHHQLPEFTQTRAHRDAIQPSHLLSSPSPPAPNPSQHQSFPVSQLLHEMAKVHCSIR